MQGLIEQFKSPTFWISVVAVGLILNVLSNYVTRIIDRGFASSSRRLRDFSSRSREKRAAKLRHISDWMDGNGNGPLLVLLQAQFLSFLGMAMIGLSIGLALLGQTDAKASSILLRMIVVAGLLAIGVTGIAAMNIGGTLLDAVRSHPKGLKGLFPIRAKSKE